MVTEQQFLNKVSKLMDRTKEDAMESAKKLYHSGALDTGSIPDDYVIPKLFMIAYGSRVSSNWSPANLTRAQKKEINNIRCFI